MVVDGKISLNVLREIVCSVNKISVEQKRQRKDKSEQVSLSHPC